MVQPPVGGVCGPKFEYGVAVSGFFWQRGGWVLRQKAGAEFHDWAE